MISDFVQQSEAKKNFIKHKSLRFIKEKEKVDKDSSNEEPNRHNREKAKTFDFTTIGEYQHMLLKDAVKKYYVE